MGVDNLDYARGDTALINEVRELRDRVDSLETKLDNFLENFDSLLYQARKALDDRY